MHKKVQTLPQRMARWPLTVAVLATLTLSLSPTANAGELDQPTAMAMAGDLLIARPAGVVLTALGSVAFVVSLPLALRVGM